MGFNLGAFARGFAERATEDRREQEDQVKDIIKASYTYTLEEAKNLRKERRAKREELKDIGNQLKAMNLSDAQVAGILGTGVNGAKRQIEILQSAAAKYGDQFDINNFVSAAEESNLTIDDAIDRIMGTPIVGAQQQANIPEAAQVRTLFGTSDRVAQEQLKMMQGAFGEDFAKLQAEVSGQYQYGDLPEIKVDYTGLAAKTPDEQTEAEIKQLQLEKLQKELNEVDKPDDLTALQEQSLVRGLNNLLAPIVAKQFGTTLSWNGTDYVLPAEASEKARAALEQSLKLASQGVNDIKSGRQYTDVIDQQQAVVKQLQYSPEMLGTVPDDEQITVDQIPQHDPKTTKPEDFAADMARKLNVAGMNEADKKNAKEKIRKALLSGDQTLSVTKANSIVNQLIP